MSINLSISAENHDDLHIKLKGILYGLAQAPAQQGSPSIAEATKGLPKMTKKQEAALKAAVEQKTEEPKAETKVDPVAEPELDASVGIPTLDDLRASLMSLSKAEGHGSEAVFKLLGEYDAKNASTVPEDKRAAVIAAVNAKLEG